MGISLIIFSAANASGAETAGLNEVVSEQIKNPTNEQTFEGNGLLIENAYPFYDQELTKSAPFPAKKPVYFFSFGMENITEGINTYIIAGSIIAMVLLFAGYVVIN